MYGWLSEVGFLVAFFKVFTLSALNSKKNPICKKQVIVKLLGKYHLIIIQVNMNFMRKKQQIIPNVTK